MSINEAGRAMLIKLANGIAKQTKLNLVHSPSDPEIREFFLSWFNNNMCIFLMLIQRVTEREPKTMMRMEFFLYEIEHHYLKANVTKDVSVAFHWLRKFLTLYPDVSAKQCEKAVEMVRRIYGVVGLKLKQPAGFIPNFKPEFCAV